MAQRNSGYERKERDLYQTPAWVTRALIPHLPERVRQIWEPAAGGGQMVAALDGAGYQVVGTDIAAGHDFLTAPPPHPFDAIVTNPPFIIGQQFIERALQLTQPIGGVVALLFETNLGHAKSRAHLFRDCPAWSKKIELLDRIVWFMEVNGKPKKSPSQNHAWFVWDWQYEGPPAVAYASNDEKRTGLNTLGVSAHA